MKKLIYYILNTLLLFNIANSQEFIKDRETKKVMYKNRLYMVDQYKVSNEKRRFAYEIYKVNENGEKGEFIGDQRNEFEDYRKISMASNFYFDKWDMINDLSKIKYLFSETNLAYKASRIINKLTEEMTEFNVDIALAKSISREKVLKIARDQATEEISSMGKELMNSIIYSYKQGEIKNTKGLEKIISQTFYNQSTVNAKKSLDKLNNIQKYLKRLDNVVVEDMLNFKEDLYSVLYEGYSNRAAQAAEVIAKGKIEYKLASIGDKILEKASSKIKDGERIYNKLKELGLDINKLDNKISYYINDRVRKDLEVLVLMLKTQEEQFNPANESSLAHKFLDKERNTTPEIIKVKRDFWAIRELMDEYDGISFDGDDLIINIRYDRGNNISTANLTEFNFKEINKNAEITFDFEYDSNPIFEGLSEGKLGISAYSGDDNAFLGACGSFKLEGHNLAGTTDSWKIEVFPSKKRYIIEIRQKNSSYVKERREIDLVEGRFWNNEFLKVNYWQFCIGFESYRTNNNKFLAKIKNMKIKFE